MKCFVAVDGDGIGSAVGRANLADDVEGVRRISNSIEAGQELWRSWCKNSGGIPVSSGGDEGLLEVPAEKLSELSDISRQYHDLVGATCTVGVGMKMSEASKALMYGKVTGKDRIVVWNAETMQPKLDELAANEKTEEEKISEAYLRKGDFHGGKQQSQGQTDWASDAPKGQPAKNRGAHAGFAGKKEPNAKAPDPKAAPPPPEETHAGDDLQGQMANGFQGFESSLHDAAQGQTQQDQEATQNDTSRLDQIRHQVAQTLGKVREQMPIISQMRQTAPDAYNSIIGLVQGVIALGKEVMGDPIPDKDPAHMQQG